MTDRAKHITYEVVSSPRRELFPWEASYPSQIRWDDSILRCGFGEYLDSAIRRFSSRTAFCYMDTDISYAELGTLALQVAAVLLALPEARDNGVALLLPNTPWHTTAFLERLRPLFASPS